MQTIRRILRIKKPILPCHKMPGLEKNFKMYLRSMSKTFMATKFLQHQWLALTSHEVHSPYLFRLNEEVLHDTRHYYAFDEIEARRDLLLNSEERIPVSDFGAGSHLVKGKERRVADIARTSLTSARFGQLLFRLALFAKPATILEMGTSLGISGSYLAKAAPEARVLTLEGSAHIARIARDQFQALNLPHVQVLEGEFDTTLPLALNQVNQLDLVFIDGNHQYGPTLAYFQAIKPYLHEHSLVIFDDVHWCVGMDKAWRELVHDPMVRVSIDLFFKGIIAFDPVFREPVHVRLRY